MRCLGKCYLHILIHCFSVAEGTGRCPPFLGALLGELILVAPVARWKRFAIGVS